MLDTCAGRTSKTQRTGARPVLAIAMLLGLAAPFAAADTIPVAILDPNLQVGTYIGAGLDQPIGIAFIGTDDALVLEKGTGLVKRAIGGVIQAAPVLDLAVNSASERGLLGIALHPHFPAVPFVYIRWTESATGLDTAVVGEVPLLGNRVDRFLWDGNSLRLDPNFKTVFLRARQTDNLPVRGHEEAVNPAERANHNGGQIRFGPDGKLYVFTGDLGRRGHMQNLPIGPFEGPSFRDDTYGGPAPDSAHLSGVVQRFNDDGSTPRDNPFHLVGAIIGGDTGRSIQTVFSYGHRNGFGMAFDPYSRYLWLTENADDAFSELNRVVPGMNGGWIQAMGPLRRIAEFKTIETTLFGGSLQQVRYPPTRIAGTAGRARARMVMLPGAAYVDPQFSWRYEIGPAGAAFVRGDALGQEYLGSLWIGSSRPFMATGTSGGSLYRMRLTPDRLGLDLGADARLADKVADNLGKFDPTESETLLIGRGFGITPDIAQGPDGNLYVVSLSDNVVYRIGRATSPAGTR
ncbi:PQQ-dependent sugar dehydrogenase [Massilia jejuensis]|uniref:PQQ-dependent sugar dehydrogenase n=1 Tax=Massilia jejuensis TaxID=648894 RepID=A0ABW0PHD2_9BURK